MRTVVIGLLAFVMLVACKDRPTKFKTIMIKSYGEVETLPDMATFRIELNCLEKTIKSSKQCLVEKSNELNKKLLSFGINKDDILTTSVDLRKSYTWRNNSSVFEGYRSSTTIYVTLKNIDKLDEIYTELLENRNLDLGGLNYSHSKLDSLKNEAYVSALKKADVLADKLLTELPESKKEVLKISNVEISASLPTEQEGKTKLLAYEMEDVASNNIAISKGTVLVNAMLYVEYQIK